jgi:endonuclease-8
LEQISPFVRVRDLGDHGIIALYRRAAQLLGENLGGGPRTTRKNLDRRGRLWVYGRADLPCLRCATQVERVMLGTNPRSTYWCAGCQDPEARSAFSGAAPRSGRRPG